MGSQAEYWTDIYATTHEQRLAQSMEAARAELKDKYQLDQQYIKWLGDKQLMLEQELTKTQDALDQYSRGRLASGKRDSSSDAALLGVIAEAGNTIARETGDAAQRKLEAEAAVEGRYRLSGEQSNAIGRAGDYFSKVDVASITTSPDVQRNIDAAIAEIGPGSFAAGTDAAKTGTAELYARLDRALSGNRAYQADPTLKQYLATKVAQKMGTNTSYVVRSAVDTDKTSAVTAAKTEVGKTGTGTSARAAQLAEEALKDKLGGATEEEKKAIATWFSTPQGQAYREALTRGASYNEAFLAASNALPEGALASVDTKNPAETAAVVFKTDEGDIRTLLQTTGASFDIAKFFDPTYLDIYGRSQTLKKQLEDTFTERGQRMEALAVPSEEAVRRRGAEIYEPVSPGVGARRRAAAVREEEARMGEAQTPGVMRKSTGIGSVDDFLASRLTTPAIPEEQRVVAGASAAAVRYGPKFVPSGEWDADADQGWRMYRNVSEKMLRDTSPKGLVQHAADLAGGDPKKRDEILQSYYQWTLGEKQGLESRKRETRVETVEEKPKPVDISGIKSEELEF